MEASQVTRTLDETVAPRVICLVCNQSYKNKETLWKHKTAQHGATRIKTCDFCNQKISYNNIAAHQKICRKKSVEQKVGVPTQDGNLPPKSYPNIIQVRQQEHVSNIGPSTSGPCLNRIKVRPSKEMIATSSSSSGFDHIAEKPKLGPFRYRSTASASPLTSPKDIVEKCANKSWDNETTLESSQPHRKQVPSKQFSEACSHPQQSKEKISELQNNMKRSTLQKQQSNSSPKHIAPIKSVSPQTSRPKRQLNIPKPTEKEKLEHIQDESHLVIQTFHSKGRGIVASRPFKKGDWIVEYKGALVDSKKARQLEQSYSKDVNIGSHMLQFKMNDKTYWIDATEESAYKARLINHSRKNPNIKPKSILVGKPRVVFVAIHDIDAGVELLFDYGDRSPSNILENPWLKD